MVGFIFKVLLFALTIAFLCSWGIIKQQRKQQELLDKLYHNSEKKVLQALKKHETLNMKQIKKTIEGTKASLFWSKSQIKVTDPTLVAETLVRKLMEKHLIDKIQSKGKEMYCLKNDIEKVKRRS